MTPQTQSYWQTYQPQVIHFRRSGTGILFSNPWGLYRVLSSNNRAIMILTNPTLDNGLSLYIPHGTAPPTVQNMNTLCARLIRKGWRPLLLSAPTPWLKDAHIVDTEPTRHVLCLRSRWNALIVPSGWSCAAHRLQLVSVPGTSDQNKADISSLLACLNLYSGPNDDILSRWGDIVEQCLAMIMD